jgi:hypothetical protein
MDVIEKIRAGRYNNNVFYDHLVVPVDEDTMTVRQAREHKEEQQRLSKEQRFLYHKEDLRLEALLKADLEAEFELAGHAKADKLWAIAWEREHSSGYESVARAYEELAELVR